jgi:hypothetical protein
LRRLLIYLWEHRGEPVSEYAIGVDVLGKREDFDPKIDAAVRVHVARLRQKLREYYESEANDAGVRFSVPAGAYRVEVEVVAAAVAPETGSSGVVEAPRFGPWTWVLAAATVVLAAAVVWLSLENRTLAAAKPAPAPALPKFWARLLGNGRLTRIVIPTPVFFMAGDLRVRDVSVNDPNTASFPLLKNLASRGGKVEVNQSYSVASDSIALATLTRLLSPARVPLAFGVTRDLSLELFASDNLIFLGIPHTSEHVAHLMARTAFYLESTRVKVRQPQPGERAVYAASRPSQQFGVVSVLPGQTSGTRLVLLTGGHAASLASFLTAPVTLREVDRFLESKGDPEYFEMVVEAETDGANLLKAHPVAFRPVPATLWK